MGGKSVPVISVSGSQEGTHVAENLPQCDWNGGGCPLALSLERGWGLQPSLEPLALLRQSSEARPGSEECGWSFHQHVLVYDAQLQLGCEILDGRCGPGTSRLHRSGVT